jgi:hypothetical protein
VNDRWWFCEVARLVKNRPIRSNDQMTSEPRPPIADAPVSLVLIAWNAASELSEILAAWQAVLQGLKRPYEILLVDDGSTDGTADEAERAAHQTTGLRVLRHTEMQGQGVALAAGVASAQYPLLCYAPCDKEFLPADFQRLHEAINDVDIVTGFRVGQRLPMWPRIWHVLQHLLARIFLGSAPATRESWVGWPGWRRRWLARWVFGLRVQDPECAFRLFRRDFVGRIPMQCRGSLVHIEILAKANHLGGMIAEVPVTWMAPEKAFPEPPTLPQRDDLTVLFRHPEFRTHQVEVAPSDTSGDATQTIPSASHTP